MKHFIQLLFYWAGMGSEVNPDDDKKYLGDRISMMVVPMVMIAYVISLAVVKGLMNVEGDTGFILIIACVGLILATYFFLIWLYVLRNQQYFEISRDKSFNTTRCKALALSFGLLGMLCLAGLMIFLM